MVENLITAERYNTLLKSVHWKKSKIRYREENDLSEDIYMDDELFERINCTLDAREYTHDYLRNLGAHGSLRNSGFFKHEIDRKMFFRTRDSLTELELILTRTSKLNDRGRAYILEWGRRHYE